MKFTKIEAKKLGQEHKINFNVVPFDEFLYGLNAELEHKDITHNDKEITFNIVCAHLKEDPRYYHYLKIMEDARTKYYKTHIKPSIFLL